MQVESSMDRTARWVQQHSQRSSRQQSTASRSHLKPPLQEGMSSQQSSRTDLGGQDNGVGSGGRAYARQSTPGYGYAQPGASHYSRQPPPVEGPLSSSHHRRSRSHPTSVPQDHRTPPRLNIPTALYRHPDLPAFVQGPPGSGYPMTMTPARRSVSQTRAAVPHPPSPPLQVPTPLNPKKSRPTVHKRRPSLSGETFEPPPIQAGYPYRGAEGRALHVRLQGQGDVYRGRGRSSSESRRR